MSDGLEPKGPSQPSINTAYNTVGNPISHSSQETSEAREQARAASDSTVDQRRDHDTAVPSDHQNAAIPSSLGYGARDASGDKGEALGEPVSDTEGEQMRAPGEGDVYRKQLHKDGFGEQKDLVSDLDRKKAEQAEARDAMKAQRRDDVDVGGALGDRLGPAAS